MDLPIAGSHGKMFDYTDNVESSEKYVLKRTTTSELIDDLLDDPEEIREHDEKMKIEQELYNKKLDAIANINQNVPQEEGKEQVVEN
jgi:hypothetical protein